MLRRTGTTWAVLLAVAGTAAAADFQSAAKRGAPDLKSAGPLAFGPNGVLLVGDPQGGALFAIDTGENDASPRIGAIKVPKVDQQVAALLGTGTDQILINDMAVNPLTGTAYLSVSRGRGPDATPVIVRVNSAGKLSLLELKNVPFLKAALPNPPSPTGKQRQDTITDLAFVDGRVIVAGLSNEQFASTLRSIPFPFTEADRGTTVEIFHGAHGKFETASPVRTFVPYEIGGQAHLLAAYTCTPLVKFSVADLKPGSHVKGTTIAELGSGNRPLDMIVYQKGGKDYLLLANNKRGVMKISTEGIDKAPAITSKAAPKTGQPYETIAELQGVLHLDKLDKDHALLLVQAGDGSLNLETVPLP